MGGHNSPSVHMYTVTEPMHSLVILEQQTPDFCNVDESTRQNTRQPRTTDSDCLPGDECKIGHSFAFCFNHTHYYKIGCPCQTHDDCPEPFYTGRDPPTCGPWLF